MIKTMFGRALAAMLMLATASAAQAGGYYQGSASTGGGPVTTFFSPHNRDGSLSGTTSFNYPLPSTTQGRYVFERIGNGEPGGSGALGDGVVRTGGSAGAAGAQYPKWSITAAELVARWPGTTSLTVNFGTLGTPGAAISTASTAGNAGTYSSNLVVTSNTGAQIELIPAGGPGLGGPLSGVGVGGGAMAIQGAPTTLFSSGGGANTNGNAGLDGGNSFFGPSAGGGGGGVNASEVASAGGRAGIALANLLSTRGAAGTAGGGDGGVAVNAYFGPSCDLPGTGGAGGGSSVLASARAGNGGDGKGYGAGGGGGGAGKNGSLSGYGGAATAGCWQATYFPN